MFEFVLITMLFTLSAVINLPLGYWRSGHAKFSYAWFFYTHVSIPVILYLRIKFGLGPEFIPLTIGGAVTGQILGGWLG